MTWLHAAVCMLQCNIAMNSSSSLWLCIIGLHCVSCLKLVSNMRQAVEPDAEDEYGSPERIRHAETPELAREALIDSVVLIFKSQVEVAFREQTAGHNALLLFVHLALQMMEEQLLNAFKELRAKQAEVSNRMLTDKASVRSCAYCFAALSCWYVAIHYISTDI